MDNNSNILLQILSTVVIAAIVTGIFSLVIAFRNNKRLIELEKSKQKFLVAQEQYKELLNAYKDLLNLLPEENLLGHIIINSPLKEDSLSEYFKISDKNIKIMYSHFQKYCYLLTQDEQNMINTLIEEIDNVTKIIINLNSETKKYNDSRKNCTDTNTIDSMIIKRIKKATEFEEIYYNTFKTNLNKFQKLTY